jgi:Flp pilus assembly protein TadD
MHALSSTGAQTESRNDGTTGETTLSPCRHIRFRLVRRLGLLLAMVGLTAGAAILLLPHLRAWYHLRAARAEMMRYHTSQAIRHLLICRDIWPRDPEVLLLAARAARCARIDGDSERLLRIYRDVRGRDNSYALEKFLLAVERQVDTYSDQCWQCLEEGRFDAPLLLEALTRGYLRQYRLGQAHFCLDHWKQLQPDNPQVFYLEGLFRLDYSQDRTAAEESYRRAVELDPDHEEARLGLAVALLMGKNFAEAAKHFERLLQCQPDNLRLQAGLAECLDSLGETDKAVLMVDDVLARQPKFPAALSLRGQLALRSGQLEQAESWLRQALDGNPMDRRARYHLLLCLEQSGQDEQARLQRRKLQELEKDASRFNEIVTKEIAKRPTDPDLHFKLGQILLRAGQRKEGLRWLQSALRLDPNYAPARQAVEEYQKKAENTTPSSKAL